jgi:hypothetical protein
MKAIINQPVKSIFLRVALCGVVSLSVAAQCHSAQQGQIIQGTPKGTTQPKPAPKPIAQPATVARRQAPPAPWKTAAVAPAVAHRIAAARRPISIQNLQLVARLRHNLFAHHWSYVYAANLKHAPKSIRFLPNGTVLTDLAGEIWYWEALDGRRVSLRAFEDAGQPGITLEFNDDYTNFQYALPDQTAAVQGAASDDVADGPAPSNSADGEPTTLEQALLSYPWNWNNVSGKSDKAVRFDKDKTFQVAGRTSFWNVTGPRTVHVEFENGEQTDLLFDTTFSIYTDGNQISGSRQAEASNVAALDFKQ